MPNLPNTHLLSHFYVKTFGPNRPNMSRDYEKPVMVLISTSGKMGNFKKIFSSLKRVIILKVR